jgi:hypothetical protein
MSLSNEEQEILHEMEAQFEGHEGRLESRLGAKRVLGRTFYLPIALVIAGLALVLACFTTSLLPATLGVVMMFIAPCVWCRPSNADDLTTS